MKEIFEQMLPYQTTTLNDDTTEYFTLFLGILNKLPTLSELSR